MNSSSFDLSITALVLILDISCLTRLPRKSSCHSNNELIVRGYFRACSHVTEMQGFVQQKKLKGKWKCPKKWNYTLINLCHPVKCIHRLRCLHLEESCSLLGWLQSASFDNTEWIKSSNKYLSQQFFKCQIIFKAREYLRKNTIGDQVFISFNQLQIYQACLLCNRVSDQKYVTATRVVRHALKNL